MNPRKAKGGVFAILGLVLLSSLCLGAGKKYQMFLVTFHLEGDQHDNPKFMHPVKLGQDHRQYFFSKIPTFKDNDIEWFYPFTSRDGGSYGAAFQLKEHALQELKGVTLTNQGKLLGIRIAGSPLQHAVLIDRPVTDGVIVLWEGLTQNHLKQFRKRFPHVDDYAAKKGLLAPGGDGSSTPDSGPRFKLPSR